MKGDDVDMNSEDLPSWLFHGCDLWRSLSKNNNGIYHDASYFGLTLETLNKLILCLETEQLSVTCEPDIE